MVELDWFNVQVALLKQTLTLEAEMGWTLLLLLLLKGQEGLFVQFHHRELSENKNTQI